MKNILIICLLICSDGLFGQTLQWVSKAGSTLYDMPGAITIDDAGNIYHVGQFRATCDFDPGPGIMNLSVSGTLPSVPDAYLCKLNNNGNLVWAKQASGTGNDYFYEIILDHDKNLIVSGQCSSTDIDLGPGISIFPGGDLVAKYDTAGNLIWFKKCDFGGPLKIKVDDVNNILISSYIVGTIDCDPGPGVFNLSGLYTPVIVKLDSAGNFIWAIALNSTNTGSYEQFEIIPVSNSIYLSGKITAITMDMDPGPGTYNISNSSGYCGFIAKYDSAGNFIWAHLLQNIGGSQTFIETGWPDALGNIVVAGSYSDTVDFDPGPGTFQAVSTGTNNLFVLKLDDTGNFMWAKPFEVRSTEHMSIKLDDTDRIYVTADFFGTADFDPGPGTVNLTAPGFSSDVFLLSLNSTGDYQWVKRISGSNHDRVYDLVIDTIFNVYTCGSFLFTADFNPPNMVNLTSSGEFDIFVTKYDGNLSGINEKPTDISLSVYPNPSSEDFLVKLPESEEINYVEITDITGRIIKAVVRRENSELRISFDSRPGVYNVRICTNKNYLVSRLMKE